jgi:hypothetical protein
LLFYWSYIPIKAGKVEKIFTITRKKFSQKEGDASFIDRIKRINWILYISYPNPDKPELNIDD